MLPTTAMIIYLYNIINYCNMSCVIVIIYELTNYIIVTTIINASHKFCLCGTTLATMFNDFITD